MTYTGSNEGQGRQAGAAKTPASAMPWLAAAIAAAAIMIFWHLGMLPLLNPDEGRNASVGWEMQQAGTWLVPTYNGLAYLDKPAFFFKAVAFSLSLFGHNEYAARLPSALFAAGTLAMVFGFCRREYDLRTAALAVSVVSTTPLFFAFARYVIFDMTLAFFVCGAIFAGYFTEKPGCANPRRWSLLAAAAMGCATLVKGPVGFIIPLLVLGIFHRVDGRRGAMKRLLCWRNVLLFLALFLPWFIGVSLQRHDFPYYGVIRESVLRFTTKQFHRSQPFWFYLPVILGTMLFWSLTLPQTLYLSWKQRLILSRADKLLLVWAVAVAIFFSISQSKLPGYILSGVIALGILVARRFAASFENPAEKSIRTGGLLLAVISAAGAAIAFFYHGHLEVIDPKIRFDDAAGLILTLHAAALPLATGLCLAAFLAFYGVIDRNPRAVFTAFLLCPLLFIILLLPALNAGEQHRASHDLALDITQAAPGAAVACYLCFPPGIPFYLGRDITVITGRNGAEIQSNYIQFALGESPVWPENMQPAAHFNDWISQLRQPTYLLAEKAYVPVLETLAAARHSQVRALAGGHYWGLLVTPGEH